MVYQSKLVACVKVDGKVLREQDATVTIPFGAEYSVLIKNLNSVRVMAKVSIDGKDATEGAWLIIGPNASVELERFIRNGNMRNGNRLKFIERTGKIEQHRGIQAEDGLIRIEYKTERVTRTQDVTVTRTHYVDHWYPVPYVVPVWPHFTPRPYWWGDPFYWNGYQQTYVYNSGLTGVNSSGGFQTSGNISCFNTSVQTTPTGGLNDGESVNLMSFTSSSAAPAAPTSGGLRSRLTKSAGPLRSRSMGMQAKSIRSADSFKMEEQANDAGITVPGSESNQSFTLSSGFDTHPTSEVLVIKLRGTIGGVKVARPVTVKTRAKCSTCGKKNRPNVKFCSECGTALSLL